MWMLYGTASALVAFLVASYAGSMRLYFAVWITLITILVAIDQAAEKVQKAINTTKLKGE